MRNEVWGAKLYLSVNGPSMTWTVCPLKMTALYSFETSGTTYPTTRRHILKDLRTQRWKWERYGWDISCWVGLSAECGERERQIREDDDDDDDDDNQCYFA